MKNGGIETVITNGVFHGPFGPPDFNIGGDGLV